MFKYQGNTAPNNNYISLDDKFKGVFFIKNLSLDPKSLAYMQDFL